MAGVTRPERTIRMDNRKRRRLIESSLSDVLSSVGFHHHHDSYFSRLRGPLLDVFFFQFTRSNGQFTIRYGIDSPCLLGSLRGNEILGFDPQTPCLWVSQNTDQLGPYACKHEDHIANCGSKAKADLESRAFPWFDTVKSISDFVRIYRQSEVRLDSPITPLPPGAELKCGIYGMMLAELHDKQYARLWLDAALEGWRTTSPSTDAQAEWVRLITSAINAL
jgi:hypothetical protein